jgi:hypothetical protein
MDGTDQASKQENALAPSKTVTPSAPTFDPAEEPQPIAGTSTELIPAGTLMAETPVPRAADPRISTTTGPERKAEDAPVVTAPPAPATDKKLALGDSLTIIAKAEREGKIRVLCSSMMDAAIAYPGQVVELRWVEGKVRLSIRRETAS